MATPDEELVGEAWDLDGNRVVIPTEIWRGKVLKDHPELSPHLNDALRAIYSPDHVIPIPATKIVAITTCAEPVLVVGSSWS